VIYTASGHRYCLAPEEKSDFNLPEKYRTEPKKEIPFGGTRRSDTNGLGPNETVDSTAGSRDRLVDQDGSDIKVDWYGDDDRENPMNWCARSSSMYIQLTVIRSTPKKCYTTFCIFLLSSITYFGSSILTPATDIFSVDYHIGKAPANLALALYVAGFGFGPLFLGPLSELPSIGRLLPYLISLAVLLIIQIPTALVGNFAGLVSPPPLRDRY
jgi:DHA1 family multidrug resistance protein-like MFS transporter